MLVLLSSWFVTIDKFIGSVSDLVVFISALARYNEVKSLNARLRIVGVKKMQAF